MEKIKTLAIKFYKKYIIHFLNKFKTKEQIFSEYYETNYWGDEESKSGAGSSLAHTENIRRELPKLFSAHNVRSVLDAPCGDFNWFKDIQFAEPINYIGGDIVPKLIADLNTRYASDTRSFVHMDITKDTLPKVDLMMCRDVLFHLSYTDIKDFLANFKKSGIEWLLVTSNSESPKNSDITHGNWRPLNLNLPPFNFPTPRQVIEEYPDGNNIKKVIGLWNKADLPLN